MRTYPLRNKQGQVCAFEIERLLVGSRMLSKLLRSSPDVTEIKVRRLFQRPLDIHAEFRFKGQPFIVWEPYGDNSRYWIGPKDCSVAESIDLSSVEHVFKSYSRLRRSQEK